ncbi:MAG: hypothetical protein R3B70_04490 [Polyangiaceae bacterium]
MRTLRPQACADDERNDRDVASTRAIQDALKLDAVEAFQVEQVWAECKQYDVGIVDGEVYLLAQLHAWSDLVVRPYFDCPESLERSQVA